MGSQNSPPLHVALQAFLTSLVALIAAFAPSPGAAPVGPEIDVTPMSVDYGVVDVDDGPSPREVTIRSVGTAGLTFTGSEVAIGGINPGDFSITADTGQNPLPPGGNRTVEVSFDPAFGGNTAASLIITSNDADEPSVTVALQGVGGDEEIDVSPLSLSFGNVDIASGPSLALAVLITNPGVASLDFTGQGVALGGSDPGEFLITSDTGQNPLPAGLSRQVRIAFDPTSVGVKVADLLITSEDNDEPSVTVSLDGTGTAGPASAPPEIDVSPSALDFGTQGIDGGSTPSQRVTIENLGSGELTFIAPQVVLDGTDASEFGIIGDSGQNPLAPFTARTVDVVFDPMVTGSLTAQLVITSDDADEPTVSVALSGSGTPGTGSGKTIAELVDALLGYIPATPLNDFDLNSDGLYDVGDLVTLVGPPPSP